MDIFLVYLSCFGIGLVFTLVSAFMADVFGGHEAGGHEGAGGHAEAGFSADDMPGFSALSPTTIACFVTAFGGFGNNRGAHITVDLVWANASPMTHEEIRQLDAGSWFDAKFAGEKALVAFLHSLAKGVLNA